MRQRSAVKNHVHVLGTLQKANRAMSAYEILDELRPVGIRAPMPVYRALDRLILEGDVHRLESLNAYVACKHGKDTGQPIFAICQDCGRIDEFSEDEVLQELSACAHARGFMVRDATLELRGLCQNCTGKLKSPTYVAKM